MDRIFYSKGMINAVNQYPNFGVPMYQCFRSFTFLYLYFRYKIPTK